MPDLPAPVLGGIWRYGARPLGGRSNGLNLIRLVLAAMVLFAHGFYLAGAGHGPIVNGHNIGGWAVMGFFAISGYLITGSRLRKSLGSYLVLRVARIFPAFLVCLCVIAFVFTPFAYHRTHGTLDGVGTTPTTPLDFVFVNAGLHINTWECAGTPAGLPYGDPVWNGSLWSLYYEFLCYLIIAALMSMTLFRASAWPTGVALGVSVVVFANVERLMPYVGHNVDVRLLLQLLPFFLSGAWLYMLRDRIAFTWPVASGALVVGVVVAQVPSWGPQLAAPCLAYVVLWLGAVVRSPRLVAANDISYGFYIYAWPSQQLLAMFGVHALGIGYYLDIVVYDLAAVALTVPFAVGSWLLIERRMLDRARKVTSVRRAGAQAATPEKV